MKTTALPLLFVLAGCGVSHSSLPLPGIPERSPASLSADSESFAVVPAASAVAPRRQDGEGASSGWRGSASLLLGYRQMDNEDSWEPLDGQFAIGGEVEMRPGSSPVGLEFGLLVGADEEKDVGGTGIDIRAGTAELYLGPRLTLDVAEGRLRPYLGGGVTLMAVDYEGEVAIMGGTVTASDDDTTVGGYAHAGVQIGLTERLHIGADVRGVFGTDVELFGSSSDADYLQFALLLGGSW